MKARPRLRPHQRAFVRAATDPKVKRLTVTARKTTMTNTERLRATMREHNLTRQAVADLLGRALERPVSIETVHAWLKPPGNRSARNMPTEKLKLLQLAIAAQAEKKAPAKRKRRGRSTRAASA